MIWFRAVAGCSVAALLAGAAVFAQPKPAAAPATAPIKMGSRVVTWEALMATSPGGKRWQATEAPTATLDELEIHVTQVGPGLATHPPHKHHDEEVIIIRQGTFEVFQDGTITKAGPGSIVFHASGSLHNLKNIGDTEGTYHVVKWTSPGAPKG